MKYFSRKILAIILVLWSSLSGANPFNYRSEKAQMVQVIQLGPAALLKRLQMIESATRSIEAEYFIFDDDEAGRLMIQALAKKAAQGVKVRLLVDAAKTILRMDSYFAQEIAAAGIELRYYNNPPTYRVVSGQFRDHRKLLVVDDRIAITGGRNIGSEYFAINDTYNFRDRDIVATDDIAFAMRETFEVFWQSSLSSTPPPIKGLKSEKVRLAKDFMIENAQDRLIRNRIDEVGAKQLAEMPLLRCEQPHFVSDTPGKLLQFKRYAYEELMAVFTSAQKSAWIDSPYFIPRFISGNAILGLLHRHVDVNILTNSIVSNDLPYAVPAFETRVGFFIWAGMKAYAYRGLDDKSEEVLLDHFAPNVWGVHAKSMVVDDKDVAIGTFNFDSRSKNINSEMAVICHNSPEVAAFTKNYMKYMRSQSDRLTRYYTTEDGRDLHHGAKLPKQAMYLLLFPLSNGFDWLL